MKIEALARSAKDGSRALALAATETKNLALCAMARALRDGAAAILKANALEVKAAAPKNTSAFVDRLTLDEPRLEKVAQALEHVAELPDPVGRTSDYAVRPNGLAIRKMKVPLGVIAIIYESRPGVTADAAGLCVKSGNAAILRGGREAVKTNALIAKALRRGLKEAKLPEAAIGFVDDVRRETVGKLLALDQYIDLVIPRGGPELTRMVRRESSIAVLSHDKGLCHTYVHSKADLAMAQEICFNAKAERPGVCNAMETLIVDKSVAAAFLPPMARRYQEAGVELRGCPRTRKIISCKAATAADWDTEYLDLILSIKVVDSVDDALEHIARHGSGLAEAIVTQDQAAAQRFLREADAGAVYVNASTRFTDGGEFGMGAEMGISTQKIHARGPVGLQELTCEKFIVTGNGQVRDSRKPAQKILLEPPSNSSSLLPEEIDRQIDTFFADPPAKGCWPGKIGKEESILFRLRRDLQYLTGHEGDFPDTQNLTTPILAAFAVMIGFEILARIYLGRGPLGNHDKADAFRKMLKLSKEESLLMVHFRDAVAHGYQLVAHTKAGKAFHFSLAPGGRGPGESLFGPIPSLCRPKDRPHVKHDVNFWPLRRLFLETVAEFKKSLANRNNASRRERFTQALPKLRQYDFL